MHGIGNHNILKNEEANMKYLNKSKVEGYSSGLYLKVFNEDKIEFQVFFKIVITLILTGCTLI